MQSNDFSSYYLLYKWHNNCMKKLVQLARVHCIKQSVQLARVFTDTVFDEQNLLFFISNLLLITCSMITQTQRIKTITL